MAWTPGMKRGGAALTVLAWLVGCESTPKPTTPSAAVTALAITKPPASMRAGETFQLIATATLSNGQTATSGFVVRWSTSDANTAVVSPSGLVTAKADGRATIVASTDTIAASVECVVRNGGRTLTGIVTESAPTTSVPVAGAQVTVTDGLYAGASATTDAGGAFALLDVNGVLNLKISASRFDDAQVSADTAAANGLTVRLLPTDRTVTDSAAGKGPDVQGKLTFDMHRAGRVDFQVNEASYYSGYVFWLCGEIRTSDNRMVFSKTWVIERPAPQSGTLSLDGGQRYTATLRSCVSSLTLISYSMAITHPY